MAGTIKPKRDPRIDFLRGAALLTIFIDHVPGNFLGTLTLRNFGFSDAAELFVLLAGFSSMIAYGKLFQQAGVGTGLRRVAGRCLRIYLFQVGLLLATLAVVQFWIDSFGFHTQKLRPLMHGLGGLGHGLALQALPANLNILPLYVILLAVFPVLYLGVRRWPGFTFLASAGLWATANLDHDLNLTNWLDGQGWFFNPFAWQFLFTIGLFAARLYVAEAGVVPRSVPLLRACWLYLGVALIVAAPWTNWGIGWKPFELDPDKTSLSPLRLINILAFVYVLMCAPWFADLVRSRWLRFVETCGRHSLEVFAAGTLIALIGKLLFHTFGVTWQMQVLVNGTGFAAMICLAQYLDRPARPAAPRLVLPWSARLR